MTSSLHLHLYLEMVADLREVYLFLVQPIARPFELLRRCLESQNANQSFIVMIHFKIFFHLGVLFFHYSNTLVLYKKNLILYTLEKKSFYWLELLGRRCANGPKLYICRENIIQMLKSAFFWQTAKNYTETESKIFNKRIPQSLTFGTDIN